MRSILCCTQLPLNDAFGMRRSRQDPMVMGLGHALAFQYRAGNRFDVVSRIIFVQHPIRLRIEALAYTM